MTRWLTLALAIVLVAPSVASAQGARTMAFREYLDRVMARNLDLEGARRDVAAAEARVQVGARLPEPTISGGLVSFDASHPTRTERRTDVGTNGQPLCQYATGPGGAPEACLSQLPTAVGASIDVPIELGDQQGGRMDVARVGVRQADAEVEDAVRTMRGQAANAWIDALATRLDRDRLRQALESLERLVQMNQARVTAGSIGEVELVQSRVEAQMFHARVLQSEGETEAARLGLAALLGADDGPAPGFDPTGELTMTAHTFTLRALVDAAMESRPDLSVIALEADGARASRRLAEAQRWGSIDLMASWLYSAPGTDTQFGQTDYHAIGLTIAIPLPTRFLWHGEIDEASAREEAAEARYAQARQRVEVEIRQALARYEATVAARALFDASVIHDAEQVLDAITYEYEHGGTSLVAVLVAQRTRSEVYAAYVEALASHAHALVDLETAAGIWDVSFDGAD